MHRDFQLENPEGRHHFEDAGMIDRWISIWVRGLSAPMHLGLYLTDPLCPISNHGSKLQE